MMETFCRRPIFPGRLTVPPIKVFCTAEEIAGRCEGIPHGDMHEERELSTVLLSSLRAVSFNLLSGRAGASNKQAGGWGKANST